MEYLPKKGADPNIKGKCQYASQPSTTLTQGQEGSIKPRFKQLRRLGTLISLISLSNMGRMLLFKVNACMSKQPCVNTKYIGGEYGTAIRAASRKGHVETALLLWEKGGNPGAYLLQNCQPVHLTCVKTIDRISDQLLATSGIL